jgi:signal transduction histidine kinase
MHIGLSPFTIDPDLSQLDVPRTAGCGVRMDDARRWAAAAARTGVEWEVERGRRAREWSRVERERSRVAVEHSLEVLERARAARVLTARHAGARKADPAGAEGAAAPGDGGMAPAELAGRLVAAQEEERRRISLELHDGVGQRVAAACIALGGLRDRLPAPAAAQVRDVLDVLAGVSAEVRHIAHAMHPPVLELVGLGAALRGHCAELRRLTGMEVEVVADLLPPIPREVGLCLYRVAQEALGNVAAHSGVRRATLRVSRRAGVVEVEVSDGGCGFDRGRAWGGLGLAGMSERVRLLRGTFVVESRVGAGTRIRAWLPVDPAPPAGPPAGDA